MEIVLIMLVGILELLAFVIGARVGQKVVKNEEIEIPTPRKVYKNFKNEKKSQEMQSELEKNLKAIDEYRG